MKNKIIEYFQNNPKIWLITGVAGFIGSSILEYLLNINQKVIGIDNFYSGFRENLITHPNFEFIEHDLTVPIKFNFKPDYILHHAAQVSVENSIKYPGLTYRYNINSFNNILAFAKRNNIKKVVYASSSAVYAEIPTPYSISKIYNEKCAYNSLVNTIGLRYFNIYGKKQKINSDYAAVIPKWINLIKQDLPITIYGDGKTVRDFCFINDVIIANLLSCYYDTLCGVFDIGTGIGSSLNDLSIIIYSLFNKTPNIIYDDFRKNDIVCSIANNIDAYSKLNFNAYYDLKKGLKEIIRT